MWASGSGRAVLSPRRRASGALLPCELPGSAWRLLLCPLPLLLPAAGPQCRQRSRLQEQTASTAQHSIAQRSTARRTFSSCTLITACSAVMSEAAISRSCSGGRGAAGASTLAISLAKCFWPALALALLSFGKRAQVFSATGYSPLGLSSPTAPPLSSRGCRQAQPASLSQRQAKAAKKNGAGAEPSSTSKGRAGPRERKVRAGPGEQGAGSPRGRG